jgi:hypothetical protein
MSRPLKLTPRTIFLALPISRTINKINKIEKSVSKKNPDILASFLRNFFISLLPRSTWVSMIVELYNRNYIAAKENPPGQRRPGGLMLLKKARSA